MHQQRGMTFLGFVFILIIAVSLLLASIKIVPAYIEYFSVKKIISKIGHEQNFDSMSKKEIVEEFDKGANISYVTVVKGADLEVAKGESGTNVVTVEYQVVVPLAGNLSALMDFKATTAK